MRIPKKICEHPDAGRVDVTIPQAKLSIAEGKAFMMAGLLWNSFSTLIQLDERTDLCALTAVKRLSIDQHDCSEED